MSNNKVSGLMHITGEPDTGKSTLAMTTGHNPNRICFFDDDIKTQSIADMLAENGTPFGAYYNLTKLTGKMKEIEFHNFVVSKLQAIGDDQFDVIVFDTWTRFENTFFPVVEDDPKRFRDKYSPMGKIKGAEMWNASFDYEAQVIDMMLSKAPLVILVTHVKAKYVGGVDTGALKAACKKPVEQKSRLRIWTRHNPDSPAPIGLVLKRLEKVEVGDNGIVPINVLPRKISPCTWGRIMEYWENPIGEREPSENEIPNAFELSILDGVLTDDQKQVFSVNKIQLEREEREISEMNAFAAKLQKLAPANLAQLLIKSTSELGMNADMVQAKLGLNFTQISAKYEAGEAVEIWQKLKE